MFILIRPQFTRLINLHLDRKEETNLLLVSLLIFKVTAGNRKTTIEDDKAICHCFKKSSWVFSSSPTACDLLSVGQSESTDSRLPFHSSPTCFTLVAKMTKRLEN